MISVETTLEGVWAGGTGDSSSESEVRLTSVCFVEDDLQIWRSDLTITGGSSSGGGAKLTSIVSVDARDSVFDSVLESEDTARDSISEPDSEEELAMRWRSGQTKAPPKGEAWAIG